PEAGVLSWCSPAFLWACFCSRFCPRSILPLLLAPLVHQPLPLRLSQVSATTSKLRFASVGWTLDRRGRELSPASSGAVEARKSKVDRGDPASSVLSVGSEKPVSP